MQINNITRTKHSVFVTYEIIQGHPHTVSLNYINNNVTFINLGTNIFLIQNCNSLCIEHSLRLNFRIFWMHYNIRKNNTTKFGL